MAHRLGSEGRFFLSPRARRIAGWIAAALLLIIIAVVFRLLGGNGDGTVVAPTPSGSTDSSTAAIRFGNAFDAASGEVATEAETSRFAAGDTFAYSVSPSETPAAQVYVEVVRTSGGPPETAQEPVDAQSLTDPSVIAFQVPADRLVAAFGPGQYRMLIYEDPAGDPIATGEFELVGAAVSPSTSP